MRKKIITMSALLLFCVGVFMAFYLLRPKSRTTSSAVSQANGTAISPQDHADQKDQTIQTDQAKSNADTKQSYVDTYKDPATAAPAASAGTIDVTAKTEANNTVTIVTKMTGISSGTCSLTITNGAKTNAQKADIIYEPEYASCAGFSVPVSSLGSGTWSIAVSATAANGQSLAKTITLNVQ